MSLRALQFALCVSKSTLQRWITSQPTTCLADSRGRPSRLPSLVDALTSAIEARPFSTAREVTDDLQRAAPGISVSPATVSRWRRAIGYTKKRSFANHVTTERVEASRQAFSLAVEAGDDWQDVVISGRIVLLRGHGPVVRIRPSWKTTGSFPLAAA